MPQRVTTVFACQSCGSASPKWLGRCPECGEWNTYVEEIRGAEAFRSRGTRRPRPIARSRRGCARSAVETGLAGPRPGAGRRTRGGLGRSPRGRAGDRQVHPPPAGRPCGRGAGRRSPLRHRGGVGRPGAAARRAAAASTRAASFSSRRRTSTASSRRPRAGRRRSSSWTRSRRCATPRSLPRPGQSLRCASAPAALLRYAKSRGVPVLLVGHVTKDGSLAGPKSLEHLVDAVVALEGDRTSSRRMLRATKNRFGPVDELALYEMTGEGLTEIANASAALLAERRAGSSRAAP